MIFSDTSAFQVFARKDFMQLDKATFFALLWIRRFRFAQNSYTNKNGVSREGLGVIERPD